ncbi:endo alpha-1,4 polygalactosaminidase [Schumannella luteola]
MRPPIEVLAAVVLLAGCATTPTPPPDGDFPAGAIPDYQLGGAYNLPAGVQIVARDSLEQPAPGVYSICYVNGFQTQPGEEWPDALLLHTATGERFIDPNWPDETLIDISTEQKRQQAADRIGAAVERCAASGFDAVEFDNLDSFTRSDGLLTEDDAIAFATLLVAQAEQHGLAAGQKNTSQLGDRGPEIGFTFAVAEECGRYRECAAYTGVYGDSVIDIEYADDLDRGFAEICADPDTPASTILRDRDLVPAGEPDYVYEHC